MFAKGSASARKAMAHLRDGGLLGMLVDQKLNEGLAVPFLRPAGYDHAGSGAVCPALSLPGHPNPSRAPRASAVPGDLRTADGTARHWRPHRGRLRAETLRWSGGFVTSPTLLHRRWPKDPS
jgi:Kdo2-lipid IVA lauroyltransferase/acyltransferase